MTKNQIMARLMERGTNLRQFAAGHGYKPRTVYLVVDRWAGRSDAPLGRLSYRILQDLSCEVGQEVIPGILTENAA